MSTSVFGPAYARQYDLLYQDKDYERECDLLVDVFRRFGRSAVRSVLDLGCGTGNHSWPLARRGLDVTGVDRSPDMLEVASGKSGLAAEARAPQFLQGDVQTVDAGRRFDSALMMFAVLGYQLRNEDVAAALGTVRRHLDPGGLFVCDVWYGPAVLAIRPGERVKTTPTADGTVIRSAATRLDVFRHLAEVQYQVWRVSQTQPPIETSESHVMRYFFPQELVLFFETAGLRAVHWSAFGDLDRAPADDTWNVMVVAEAV